MRKVGLWFIINGMGEIPYTFALTFVEITAKSTKQQIIDEAVPLIDDLTEQNQNLTEKLNAALILLAVTAALGMLF